MSPQEKRHGVMARIRTSDLTIERPTLYHLSYPARQKMYFLLEFCELGSIAGAGIWPCGQSGGLACRQSRFDLRQGWPLCIWIMYTPSTMSILGMDMCAIQKFLYFISYPFKFTISTCHPNSLNQCRICPTGKQFCGQLLKKPKGSLCGWVGGWGEGVILTLNVYKCLSDYGK
jgi:hypothetical protein